MITRGENRMSTTIFELTRSNECFMEEDRSNGSRSGAEQTTENQEQTTDEGAANAGTDVIAAEPIGKESHDMERSGGGRNGHLPSEQQQADDNDDEEGKKR